MNMNMHLETINLVKSLRGTYKTSDKKMLVELLEAYKKKYNCSYKHAYYQMVDGNPSYSTYNKWRGELTALPPF